MNPSPAQTLFDTLCRHLFDTLKADLLSIDCHKDGSWYKNLGAGIKQHGCYYMLDTSENPEFIQDDTWPPNIRITRAVNKITGTAVLLNFVDCPENQLTLRCRCFPFAPENLEWTRTYRLPDSWTENPESFLKDASYYVPAGSADPTAFHIPVPACPPRDT